MGELTVDEIMFRAACLRAKESGEYATNEEWAILYAFDRIATLEAELEVTESRRRDWERAAEMWKGEYEELLDTSN